MSRGARLRLAVAVALLASVGGAGCGRTLVHVEPDRPIHSKRAVLVLPGLRNSAEGHRAARE